MPGGKDKTGRMVTNREGDAELVGVLVDAIRLAWPIIEATRVGHEWKAGFAKPEGMSESAWGFELRRCRRALTVAFARAGVEVPRWDPGPEP